VGLRCEVRRGGEFLLSIKRTEEGEYYFLEIEDVGEGDYRV
jgi:hypothetical protein